MKYFYVGLCLFAAAAAFRETSEYRSALARQNVTLQDQWQPAAMLPAGVVNESSGGVAPRGNAVSVQLPQSPRETTSLSDATAADETPELSAGELSTKRDRVVLQKSAAQPAIRHRAALHDSMITPGNFEYVGAFRAPQTGDNDSTFAYGGSGVAYNPEGDSSGPDDGHPGSLFLVGHQQQQRVAEISIPVPVNSKYKQIDDLPAASLLQPFSDITDGLLEEMTAGSSEHFQLGGMVVTNGLLHWTMHKYYNVANIDYPSHGTSGLDLQSSIADGPWHLGPMNSGRPEWHSYKHAGYIFEIPSAEANQWFGGRNLISGLQISTGLQASSQGPAMFAYSLPPEGTAPGASLSAIPLVWYSLQQPIGRHHPADSWRGGAWLTLGNKQAVVIAGRKALGDFYYGEARPQDCTPDKGYHGPPYEVEMLFYSPASLIHAANGSLPAEGLRPWFRWDSLTDGGGINQYLFSTCSQEIGGLAYDRERNLLYLVQLNAGALADNRNEPFPVVHVFRVIDPT
jgi:hypothetical protein